MNPLPLLACLLTATTALGLAPGPARAARPELVSISVLPQTASLIPGQGLALRAIGHFEDGSSADITGKVVFKENTPVAKLEKNVVVARAPGVVEIRAVTKSGSLTSDENLALTVSTIVALELEPESDGIRLGDSIQWSARATLMNGATGIDVTPLMDWSSTDSSVVHMGSRNKIRGLAKARKLGTATIEARDPESGLSASLALTVVSELSTLAVAPSTRFLQLDDTTAFRAVGTFEGGHEADLSGGVTWASEDEAIARIDKSGVATPEAIGSVGIRATDKATGIGSEDSGGNAELTVVGDLISLAVDPASHEMGVGEVERFRALGLFEDAAGTFAMGSRVDWFSSDPGVAAVEPDGDVECLAPGAAVISARHKKSGITSTDTDEDGALTCTEP